MTSVHLSPISLRALQRIGLVSDGSNCISSFCFRVFKEKEQFMQITEHNVLIKLEHFKEWKKSRIDQYLKSNNKNDTNLAVPLLLKCHLFLALEYLFPLAFYPPALAIHPIPFVLVDDCIFENLFGLRWPKTIKSLRLKKGTN